MNGLQLNNCMSTKSYLKQKDKKYIQSAIEKRQEVVFSCTGLNHEEKEKFKEILQVFLAECKQENMFAYLSYCLLELLDNANRANVKRIYFKKNNLDITNPSDYQKGMVGFKQAIIKPENVLQNLKSNELTVKLLLSVNDDILLQVSNNTKITEVELNRINEKIEKTKNYTTLEDVINDIDETEGCGLGLISIILMLKKIAKDTKSLFFNLTEKETVATIKIPTNSFTQLEEI